MNLTPFFMWEVLQHICKFRVDLEDMCHINPPKGGQHGIPNLIKAWPFWKIRDPRCDYSNLKTNGFLTNIKDFSLVNLPLWKGLLVNFSYRSVFHRGGTNAR